VGAPDTRRSLVDLSDGLAQDALRLYERKEHLVGVRRTRAALAAEAAFGRF